MKKISQENIQSNQSDTFKRIIIGSFVDSTAHGIGHIFKRENIFLKFMWLICFLVSAGLCGYFLEISITEYLQHETVTHTEIVTELPAVFPSVSICNENIFANNQYAAKLLNDLFVQSGIISNGSSLTQTYPNGIYRDYSFLRYFAGLNAINPSKPSSEKKKLGLTLDQMMISCMYNLVKCSVDDFEWFMDPIYGNCYTFNGGRNSSGLYVPDKTATRPGKLNGLTLELYVPQVVDFNFLSFTAGVHVNIHNKSILPIFFDGIDASVGFQTNFAISKEFISKLPTPFSECTDDLSLYNATYLQAIRSLNVSYRQEDCFTLCYQASVVAKCKCYNPTMPFWRNDTGPCLSYWQANCDIEQFIDFFSQDVGSVCGKDCPLECDMLKYSISTSFMAYPSVAYANFLSNNPNFRSIYSNATNASYEDIRNNVLSLNIYYDTLSYMQISEKEKLSTVELVSNLGGTLGLFLGISFLSFVELADLALQICLSLSCTKSKKKSNMIFVNEKK
jgi:hypothetical protein